MESQEHIIQYQVPVQIQRSNIGLVIIDSIAANFRAEFDNSNNKKSAEALAQRSIQLAKLGTLLRGIARTHHVAVVVANQVLDRFSAPAMAFEQNPILSQRSAHTQSENSANASGRSTPRLPSNPTAPPLPMILTTNDPLSLDHQQRFFSGWGDDPEYMRDLKTPSLGLTWTNQLAARVALLKEPILKPQDYLLGPGMDIVGWKRWIKIAFASWCQDSNGKDGVPFEIWEGGIRRKVDESEKKNENGSG